MKEREYCLVTNLTRLRDALAVLRFVTPGDALTWGITPEELQEITSRIARVEERIGHRVSSWSKL